MAQLKEKPAKIVGMFTVRDPGKEACVNDSVSVVGKIFSFLADGVNKLQRTYFLQQKEGFKSLIKKKDKNAQFECNLILV